MSIRSKQHLMAASFEDEGTRSSRTQSSSFRSNSTRSNSTRSNSTRSNNTRNHNIKDLIYRLLLGAILGLVSGVFIFVVVAKTWKKSGDDGAAEPDDTEKAIQECYTEKLDSLAPWDDDPALEWLLQAENKTDNDPSSQMLWQCQEQDKIFVEERYVVTKLLLATDQPESYGLSNHQHHQCAWTPTIDCNTDMYITGIQLTSAGMEGKLPSEIGQLKRLKEIDLSDNQITSIPTTLGLLTDLQVLILDENELTSIPAEIGQLTKLTHLGLEMNEMILVPSEIGQLTALTYLGLEGNQLTSIPKEVEELMDNLDLDIESILLSNGNLPDDMPSDSPTTPTISVSDSAIVQDDSTSNVPSSTPTQASFSSIQQTSRPTHDLTSASQDSTSGPSSPSLEPTKEPTRGPTKRPTTEPTGKPTAEPTKYPTRSSRPTNSASPTSYPSTLPSALPSALPSTLPSKLPSTLPSFLPSTSPSENPSAFSGDVTCPGKDETCDCYDTCFEKPSICRCDRAQGSSCCGAVTCEEYYPVVFEERMDTDGNNKLDIEEVKSYFEQRGLDQHANFERLLIFTFGWKDANQDGYLDMDELLVFICDFIDMLHNQG